MRWICSWAMLMFFSLPVWAADWPQWLGPNRDNSSPEKIALWTAPPKVLWRQPVGEGNSSPVVADGRVFVHAKIAGKNEEELLAFDNQTGQFINSVVRTNNTGKKVLPNIDPTYTDEFVAGYARPFGDGWSVEL